MPNTIFAIVLGVLALYAIFAATRGGPRRRISGWLLLAAAAVIQALNLMSDYSIVLSVVTTIALLAGLWMVRSHTDSGTPAAV